MPLNLPEQALIRGWIERLGWIPLGAAFLNGADLTTTRRTVLALRRRLAEHAQQAGRPDLETFWRREPTPGRGWIAHAHRHLAATLALPVAMPTRADPVGQWFPARIAQRLVGAGLETVDAVIAAGEGRAAGGSGERRVLEAFFTRHREALGLEAWGRAARLERQSLSPVNPLPDWFAGLPALSGASGRNRAPAALCRLDVAHDYAALAAWWSLWPEGSATRRTYRKEAERWLLWALLVRGKALSDLTVEDSAAYREFLKAPDPAWVGTGARRWSRDWKPFQGPLSPRSRRQAEVILCALATWLVKQRYWDSSPWEGLPKLGLRLASKIQVDRAFTAHDWTALLELADTRAAAETDPAGPARRLAFLLRFAHATGLRLAELAQARLGDVQSRSTPRGLQWWLRVVGKGQRERHVPLPSGLVTAMKAYLQARGRSLGSREAEAPLIGRCRQVWTPGGGEGGSLEYGLTPNGLHQILRGFFRDAATALRSTDPEAAARLARASAHWLRHTHATHALAGEVPLTVVRDNLGHQSLSTTSVYLHSHADERHAAMEKVYAADPAEPPVPSRTD